MNRPITKSCISSDWKKQIFRVSRLILVLNLSFCSILWVFLTYLMAFCWQMPLISSPTIRTVFLNSKRQVAFQLEKHLVFTATKTYARTWPVRSIAYQSHLGLVFLPTWPHFVQLRLLNHSLCSLFSVWYLLPGCSGFSHSRRFWFTCLRSAVF